MASKKKTPSFEIPDAVREAGQSGWVYRTGIEKTQAASTRSARPKQAGSTRSARSATKTRARVKPCPAEVPVAQGETPVGQGFSLAEGTSDVVASTPEPAASEVSIAGRVLGFGLQMAAVPLVVPLFLTAAVSRRLGLVKEE